MAHHKRRRPKQRRGGCLLCKPHKLPALKKATRRLDRNRALLHEAHATTTSVAREQTMPTVVPPGR